MTASTNIPWNPRLAHLRLLAALLVLEFHTYHSFFGHWQPQPALQGWGWLVEGHTGVTLFFVLSGYLFMSIAVRCGGEIDYWKFMRNRVLRIFPLFLLVFMVAVSIQRDAFQPQDVLYLFFSNLGTAPTSGQFITGAAWTISVEFSFYLIFPFIARFALAEGPGYLVRLMGLLILFKVGAFWASAKPTLMIYSTLIGRLDQFLLGMLAAQLALRHIKKDLHGAWLLVALMLMWTLLEVQARYASYFLPLATQPFWLAWPTIEALGWAMVVVAHANWRGQFWTWAEVLAQRGGEASFSLYLWHGLVITVLSQCLGTPAWFADWRINAALMGGIVLIPAWVVARLSYRTIEAPFLHMRSRYVLRIRSSIS